ncbi:MAG TPA: aminotransferase class V-fold PLP-dependent enzyme [Acidimicrobiales bacterium]|nr:aminotransferase class V-fold PLP-dependent enzyme [Acidimicrobiales bacterium]
MTTPLPRDQFPVTERFRYFDHAGVSPIPRVAAEAARWWADRMLTQGKVDYDELDGRQEATRVAAAELMGVPSVDLAFVKNTTEGLAFVAGGLDLGAGDRVVVPDLEFPSTLFPWLALQDRGVIVDRVAPVGTGRRLHLEDFERVIHDGRPPAVVVVSWVQYGRGWRIDLAALAKLAHDAGALFCADVIQGVGVIPADLAAWDVDFAMADGHKWFLGPEGIGVLYVAERVRDRLRPLEPGWASVVHRAEWDNLDLVWDHSARRYEGGTYNMAGTMALGASLNLIRQVGVPAIWRHVDGLCDRLVEGLAAANGVTVLTERDGDGRSAIVTFAVDGLAAEHVVDRLGVDGFVCAARGGGVRVAPHGYNTAD